MDPVQNIPDQGVVVPPEQTASWVTPLLWVGGIASFLVVGIFLIFLFVGNKPSQNSLYGSAPTAAPSIASGAIHGTVYFQGYAPTGSYIAIAEKGESDTDFKDVVSGLQPAQDGTAAWTWKDAKIGKNYLIKATLKVQGKVIESSPVQDVSAPATSVSLPLVSQIQPPAPTNATLSGQINLDGYAPAGSSLQVLAKTVGAVSFQTVQSSITAVDNANWSWSGAKEGTTYDIKAQLVDANNNVISKGDTQTVTAPSSGELLNVYSGANPPEVVSTAGISGTIIVNGAIPSGSYITLATRPTGTSAFNQVASNISATNNVGFSWSGATSENSYDVQAYLWVNSKPYAASNILTVTAPSTFDILTINAQQPTSAPQSGSFNVSCGGTSGGLVQATINFNTAANLPNASSYNIVVTSASQNTQVVNTTVNPPNPTQSQSITTTYVFQPGATYYAQYAYATSVGGQMSALSPSIQFACQ